MKANEAVELLTHFGLVVIVPEGENQRALVINGHHFAGVDFDAHDTVIQYIWGKVATGIVTPKIDIGSISDYVVQQDWDIHQAGALSFALERIGIQVEHG